jgi:hypothetical protein
MSRKIKRDGFYDLDGNPCSFAVQSNNRKWTGAVFLKNNGRMANIAIIKGKKLIAYFIGGSGSTQPAITNTGILAVQNSRGPNTPSRIDFYFPDLTSVPVNAKGTSYIIEMDYSKDETLLIARTAQANLEIPVPLKGDVKTGKNLRDLKEAVNCSGLKVRQNKTPLSAKIFLALVIALVVYAIIITN